MRRLCLLVASCLVAHSPLGGAQEEPAPEFFEEKKDVSVRLSGELKVRGARHSGNSATARPSDSR